MGTGGGGVEWPEPWFTDPTRQSVPAVGFDGGR